MPKADLFYFCGADGMHLVLPTELTQQDRCYVRHIEVDIIAVPLTFKWGGMLGRTKYVDYAPLEKLRENNVVWQFRLEQHNAEYWTAHCYFVSGDAVKALGCTLPTY